MAAVAAKVHCEDSRDNGYLERKIPRRKIGLDNEVDTDCCMLAKGRCASSCAERDLVLEKTTPLSSQVGNPITPPASFTLLCLVSLEESW